MRQISNNHICLYQAQNHRHIRCTYINIKTFDDWNHAIINEVFELKKSTILPVMKLK